MALISHFELCVLLDTLAIYKIWDIVFLPKAVRLFFCIKLLDYL